jgi:hypothetical protein
MSYAEKPVYLRPAIKDTPESLETQRKLLHKFNKAFCLLKSTKTHTAHFCYTTLQEVNDAIANLSGKEVEQLCLLLQADSGDDSTTFMLCKPIFPWYVISKKKLSSSFRKNNEIYWRKPSKKDKHSYYYIQPVTDVELPGEDAKLLKRQTEVEALKEFATFIENHYRSERNKGLETFYAEELPTTLTLLTKQILELALTNGASIEEKARIARNELVVATSNLQKALDATTPLERIQKLQASLQEDSSASE